MKKTISLGIVLTLVLTAVAGIIAFPGIAHTESDPDVKTLWAGQNIDVGTVSVWNNGTHINVTYRTTDDWNLTETHLYVGKTNPNMLSHSPGQFPYSHYIDPADDEDNYSIPLSMIDGYHLKLNKKGNPTGNWEADGNPGVNVGDTIYIAAHAVVENITITYDTCTIDFEQFSEYDLISSVMTGCGEVTFWMVDYTPLIGLSVGETATLTVKDDLPIIAEELTMGDDYYGLVAFTAGGLIDDWVIDDSGTGVGGKMLTDSLDYSQSTLLYHAYTKYQAILVNVSNIPNVDTLNFVGIDLDHNELWHFQYFDENNVLLSDVTVGPGTSGGDGKAYPTYFTDSRIEKVAIWGEQNLLIPDRLGFAIDNIEVDTREEIVQEETAWGDGDEFSTNWAMYFTYTIQEEEQHDWVLLETITVPAIGTKMTSINSLNNGETYKFVASGTCNWRVPPSSGGYQGDAEYWLRHDAYGEGWTHMGIWSLAMWDGTNPVEVEWGAYNDAHIYEKMFTPSANGQVTFFFNDDVYTDNSGSLTVDIYEWV